MAHLRVHESVKQLTPLHRAAADPGSDRNVDSVPQPFGSTHFVSASAAPFTSVSRTTGSCSARWMSPATSTFRQPSFGVDVM